jgi:hypothetical protein
MLHSFCIVEQLSPDSAGVLAGSSFDIQIMFANNYAGIRIYLIDS